MLENKIRGLLENKIKFEDFHFIENVKDINLSSYIIQ